MVCERDFSMKRKRLSQRLKMAFGEQLEVWSY